MAKQEMLLVGSNTNEVYDRDFADSIINGCLCYDDTNHQLSRPYSYLSL